MTATEACCPEFYPMRCISAAGFSLNAELMVSVHAFYAINVTSDSMPFPNRIPYARVHGWARPVSVAKAASSDRIEHLISARHPGISNLLTSSHQHTFSLKESKMHLAKLSLAVVLYAASASAIYCGYVIVGVQIPYPCLGSGSSLVLNLEITRAVEPMVFVATSAGAGPST